MAPASLATEEGRVQRPSSRQMQAAASCHLVEQLLRFAALSYKLAQKTHWRAAPGSWCGMVLASYPVWRRQ